MIASPQFTQLLKWGKVGETSIASWLRRKGYTILPVYDIPLDTGKGPTLFTAFASGLGELVAPDMLTILGKRIQWMEAKRKTRFTWRRIPVGRWQTGIDLRHYQHYRHVREHTQLPLWILFLHECSIPSASDLANGCPAECPTGLYGGEINHLKSAVSHEDKFRSNGRMYPMVYWDMEKLRKLASLEEVVSA